MIWVSWRQHRSQAITCLGLLGILAVFAITVSSSMRTAFSHDRSPGASRKPRQPAPGRVRSAAFMNSFNTVVNIGFWALLLAFPGLIGVVIGAPLIASELEYGTWQLAWAQTIPRTRWLVTKLAIVTGGLVILGAAMTAIITWYRQPMDRLTGHFINNVYDFEGLALTAYILLAFGLAVLAGLLIRRSIPAMAAALVAWLAVGHGRVPAPPPLPGTAHTPANLRPRVLPERGHHIRATTNRPHRGLGAPSHQPRKPDRGHLPAGRPVLELPVGQRPASSWRSPQQCSPPQSGCCTAVPHDSL